MSDENGNGELAQLLRVKRDYRKAAQDLEAELKTKFEENLANGKKRLKEQYLEKIVDVVFAETAPAVAVEEKKVEPSPDPSVCATCGSKLDLGAKFCSQCATPIEEVDLKDANVTKVAFASRKRSVRVR